MNMVNPIKVSEEEVVGFGNLYSSGRSAPLWEQAIITLWFFVTYLPLDGVAPIRYLLVAYFVGLTVMFYREILPVLFKCWPLFLLPIFGLLSFSWSPYPSEALRSGVLMLLTPLTIIVIGVRLNTRQVLRCLMFAGMITTIYVTPTLSTFADGGAYGSKNLLAMQMLFAMLMSLVTALNDKEPLWIRLLGLAFVPICFVYQYLAHSATSLVFAVVGIAGMIGVRYFWIGFGKIRHLRLSLAMFAAFIALSSTMIVLSLPENTLMNDFLGLLGKDSTFSGRALIWREAELVSQEHPILGLGLEGFWQYDVGAAQTINENDFKAFGTKLTFHNAYWEVRVHLGYVGLVLFMLILGWCMKRTTMNWLKAPGMDSSALLITMIIIFTSTFTESSLWSTFNTLVNLFYFGAMTTMGAGSRKFEGRVPVVIRHTA
jgi:exopolysaccharide production protein ExoQ